jgi:hypothetical protein
MVSQICSATPSINITGIPPGSSWIGSPSPARRLDQGSLIVLLIGLKAAGMAAAAVSFAAMFAPSCLAVHIITRY